MAFGAPGQVGQAAASGAVSQPDPVVDHRHHQPGIVGVEVDADLGGVGMFGHVGQRFPQHRLHIGDDRLVADGVQRPHELHLGADAEQWGELVDNGEGGATQRPGGLFLECEDCGADLPNGVVELFNGAGQAPATASSSTVAAMLCRLRPAANSR